MTDRSFERGRGEQLDWRDQGNGFRGQPGFENQFGQQGSYGGQVVGQFDSKRPTSSSMDHT